MTNVDISMCERLFFTDANAFPSGSRPFLYESLSPQGSEPLEFIVNFGFLFPVAAGRFHRAP